MAYKRRYLSGQEAVTVDIAEDAITPDKIQPGAVGPEALAPDSVSGEKIIPGTIETSDLKDELITSPKISPGAVDTEALAAKCVTQEKLSDEILPSVRPFSPGISTAEIADDAVDHSKLGPEAVESDSIKPGAVDTAAVAHDAITDDKISDDAVQSEHVENGAIVAGKCANDSISEPCIVDGSCTHDKIGAGAVYGDRIPDGAIDEDHLAADSVGSDELQADAVTTEKLDESALAQRHIVTLRLNQVSLFEEFIGSSWSNKWIGEILTGAQLYIDDSGSLRMYVGMGVAGSCRLYAPYVPDVLAGVDQSIDFRAFFLGMLGDGTARLGIYADDDNYIAFRAINPVAAGTVNWYAVCRSGGVETAVDTGIGFNAGEWVFSLRITGLSKVEFFINGVSVAEITTNIPTAFVPALDAYLLGAGTALQRMQLRYVSLLATRPAVS